MYLTTTFMVGNVLNTLGYTKDGTHAKRNRKREGLVKGGQDIRRSTNFIYTNHPFIFLFKKIQFHSRVFL